MSKSKASVAPELDEKSLAEFHAVRKNKRKLSPAHEITTPSKRQSTPSVRKYFSATDKANKLAKLDAARQQKQNGAPSSATKFGGFNEIGSSSSLIDMSLDGNNSELDKTEVIIDEFEKNTAIIGEMIQKKDNPLLILDKLVKDLASSHKAMISNINTKCEQLHSNQVAAENNLLSKISELKQESADKFDSIEVSQKCALEGSTLWLSFTDPSEIDNLVGKSKASLIKEAKAILTRMEIWTNSPNRLIVDVKIQKSSVRNGTGYASEHLLGIKFISSSVVHEIKRLISSFNKGKFIAKDLNAMRYYSKDNWSPLIWKLLRVCYELSSLKLIKNANVVDNGISISIENCSEEEPTFSRKLIRNESDLDKLRSEIGDIAPNIGTFEFYNGEYFALNKADRTKYRTEFSEASARLRNNSSPAAKMIASSPSTTATQSTESS